MLLLTYRTRRMLRALAAAGMVTRTENTVCATMSNVGTSARSAHEDVPIGPGTAGTDGVISVVQSVPTVRSKYIRKTGRAGTTATEPNPSTSPQRDTTSIRVFDGG